MHAASSSTSVIAGSSQAGTAGPQGRAHGIGSRSRFGKDRNILLDRLFGRLPIRGVRWDIRSDSRRSQAVPWCFMRTTAKAQARIQATGRGCRVEWYRDGDPNVDLAEWAKFGRAAGVSTFQTKKSRAAQRTSQMDQPVLGLLRRNSPAQK